MKQYYTVFNEKMSEEQMVSLDERVKEAISYEKSLSAEERAKLHDFSDVEKMMRGILQ